MLCDRTFLLYIYFFLCIVYNNKILIINYAPNSHFFVPLQYRGGQSLDLTTAHTSEFCVDILTSDQNTYQGEKPP